MYVSNFLHKCFTVEALYNLPHLTLPPAAPDRALLHCRPAPVVLTLAAATCSATTHPKFSVSPMLPFSLSTPSQAHIIHFTYNPTLTSWTVPGFSSEVHNSPPDYMCGLKYGLPISYIFFPPLDC